MGRWMQAGMARVGCPIPNRSFKAGKAQAVLCVARPQAEAPCIASLSQPTGCRSHWKGSTCTLTLGGAGDMPRQLRFRVCAACDQPSAMQAAGPSQTCVAAPATACQQATDLKGVHSHCPLTARAAQARCGAAAAHGREGPCTGSRSWDDQLVQQLVQRGSAHAAGIVRQHAVLRLGAAATAASGIRSSGSQQPANKRFPSAPAGPVGVGHALLVCACKGSRGAGCY